MLARNKRSSLFGLLIDDEEKSFIPSTPGVAGTCALTVQVLMCSKREPLLKRKAQLQQSTLTNSFRWNGNANIIYTLQNKLL